MPVTIKHQKKFSGALRLRGSKGFPVCIRAMLRLYFKQRTKTISLRGMNRRARLSYAQGVEREFEVALKLKPIQSVVFSCNE